MLAVEFAAFTCLFGVQVAKSLLKAANDIKRNGALQRLLDRDAFHDTALHRAARSKNPDTVELLLQTWSAEVDKLGTSIKMGKVSNILLLSKPV